MAQHIPGAIARLPENKNTALDNKFKFAINKLPHVEYFLKGLTLPSMSLDILRQPNPFQDIPLAGTKLQFDATFPMTFNVDEEYNNYKEIYYWMVGIGFPDEFKQYKDLVESMKYTNKTEVGRMFSDGRLIVYSSHFTRKFEIIFERMFPVSLTGIDFNTEDANMPTATVSFAYRRWRFETETTSSTG